MLTVLIPCFNEEKLLKESFNQILKSIKFCKIKKYEIIFIDDGSLDKSLSICKEIRARNKNIKIIQNKKNYGIGYNFFKGIKKSKEKYLIQIPADNSHPSKEIVKLLKFMKSNYDIVTTYYSNNSQRSKFRNF